MNEGTSTSTVRVIYRCKRHKTTVRRVFVQTVERYRSTTHPQRLITGRIRFFDGDTDVTGMGGSLPRTECQSCPERQNNAMLGQPVKGRLVDTIKCGSKCVNAVGPSCDCSCSGDNHGAGFDANQVLIVNAS